MSNDRPARVVILGSTGSIGRQAIEVVRAHPGRLEIAGLVAGSDEAALARQATELDVADTGLGEEAAVDLARAPDTDIVLNGIVGAAGLRASVAALESGKTLALANKESLVAGGEACVAAASRGGGRIVPVDSEHAAIAECLTGRDPDEVEGIVLTASGGPFREREDLSSVGVEEALVHPTWEMGPKITIDSATLMNKGLEAIEAHFLFGFEYDAIEVVIHPQSVVHGIVRLRDGSAVMHAAPPDMRIPIQAALIGRDDRRSWTAPLDLAQAAALQFEPLDAGRFPAVALAYEAGRKGSSYPAVLNAANEVGVRAFLDDALAFPQITELVEEVLAAHDPVPVADVDAVLSVDRWARARSDEVIGSWAGTRHRGLS